MRHNESVSSINGVGPALKAKLAILGIHTTEDLINFYPRRYEDYSKISQIRSLKPGIVTIKATVKEAKGHYVRRGMHITEAVASDSSGSVRMVWFNQPYRAASIKGGQEYYIRGNFGLSYRRLSIQSPSMELVSDFPIKSARIVPIYRQTKGLKSDQISKLIRDLIPEIRNMSESLPNWLVADYKLMAKNQATEQIHFPDSSAMLEQARQRLGFEEVFHLTLASLLNKEENQHEASRVVEFNQELAVNFTSSLPFKLTDSQRSVVWQIYQDMQGEHPMNRLVEGDVGSGKTIIATMAAVMAIKNGMQAVFIAPTEILAKQHADSMTKLLKPLGMDKEVSLLTGSMNKKTKEKVYKSISSGKTNLIVGTHALIEDKVSMLNLNLVIVDEQHRFGVEQRKKLLAKAGHMPHVLSLTATPIPRTLALTLYGELDISILAEKPVGRSPILTEIIPPSKREKMNELINRQISDGRQVFVVCPLISESSVSERTSAEKVYEQITKEFKHAKVALLHGKMKSTEKEKNMQDFVENHTNILVSTTVVEVGVDVPNATVMVIENAESFGLAQIHQLRGRVGRGKHQSYCFLTLIDNNSPSARLQALERSQDGFKLAELDLEIRGPGAIYGTAQHGALDLRIAQLSDHVLIAQAQFAAKEFIARREKLLQYKELHQKVTQLRKVTNLN